MTATALDVRFLALAKSLLDKYGKSVTFYPVTDDTDGSAYDVNTGTISEGDGTAIVTKCAIVPTGKTSRTGQDMSNHGVRQADHFMYVPATDFEVAPKAQDRVVLDSERYQVLAVEYFYSGEQAAMYGVYVRKP